MYMAWDEHQARHFREMPNEDGATKEMRPSLLVETFQTATNAMRSSSVRWCAIAVVFAACCIPPVHSAADKTIRGRHVDVGPIAAVQCNVTTFGAKGDGVTDDTKAIQAAFDHCGGSGGGTVVIPAPKTFLIFSIHFTASNQELHIEEGARLLRSDDVKAWGNLAKHGG